MTACIIQFVFVFVIPMLILGLPSHSFKAAFQQAYFVDKSEMIKIFFEQNTTNMGKPHYYYITAPRRFGKSVNIDMVHEFVAVDLDDFGDPRSPKDTAAYDIFSKLNIGRYPNIISEHLARYPVIHLDLMGIATPETHVANLVKDLNTILWYELQQYPQLKNLRDYPNKFGLGEHEMTFLKNLQDKKLNMLELESSLLNFVRVLYEVFHQPVVVLLHEYDETAFVSYITMKSYVLPIYRYLNEIVARALNLGKPYIKIAIINAVTTLPYGMDHHFREAVTHYAFLDDHPFTPFYGFTESEVNSLFDKYECNQTERQTVLDYYQGYKTAKNQTVIYNSMSIAFYFKDRPSKITEPYKLKNHFRTCDYADRLSLFTKDNLFRTTIETLINNGSMTTSIKKAHDNMGLRNLELLRDRRWVGTLSHHTAIFFTQCFEMGYFSHGSVDREFVIPNQELLESLQDNIEIYYRLYTSTTP
ncbi:hypothetical protein U1Q18_048965 [Sarracenia purpurea var. burkii]